MQVFGRNLDIQIADDNEAFVPLWRPSNSANAPIPLELRDRIIAFTEEKGGPIWLPMAFCAVMLVSMGGDLFLIGLGAFVLAATIISRRGHIKDHAKEIRATLLSARRCASCGYDLRGTPQDPADPRALTICPECRAAWSLPPDDESHPLGAGDHAPWRDDLFNKTLNSAAFRCLRSSRAYSLVDEHGRIVDLVFPWVTRRLPSSWSTLSPEEQRELKHRLAAIHRGRRVVMGVGCLIVAAVMLTWFLPFGSEPAFLLLIVSLYLVFALNLLFISPGKKTRNEARDTLLSAGRCASCAASLPHTEPGQIADCTTCRAAWKIPQRQRSLTPQPTRRRDPERTLVYSPPRD